MQRVEQGLHSQGPHSHILMMWGSNRGSYFIPKKIPTFFSIPQKNPSVFLHQQILLFIFWKAKTCQLQLWFWSKTKLWADQNYNTQKNPSVVFVTQKIPFGQNARPKKILQTPPSLKYVSGAPGFTLPTKNAMKVETVTLLNFYVYVINNSLFWLKTTKQERGTKWKDSRK